jgi:heme-degrading monooxygenase HmoA
MQDKTGHDARGEHEIGEIAVIFRSQRNARDDAGYHAAADAMERLATAQPGYRGIVSTRDGDGQGITISYWADDAAAVAWRDHPGHAVIRERGRAIWYDSYEVIVARTERRYRWSRT